MIAVILYLLTFIAMYFIVGRWMTGMWPRFGNWCRRHEARARLAECVLRGEMSAHRAIRQYQSFLGSLAFFGSMRYIGEFYAAEDERLRRIEAEYRARFTSKRHMNN